MLNRRSRTRSITWLMRSLPLPYCTELDFGPWTLFRHVRMPRIPIPAKSLIMNRHRLLTALLFTLLMVPLMGAGHSGSTPLPAKKTLRVMTYNIHVGVGMDKKLDLQRIADVINR